MLGAHAHQDGLTGLGLADGLHLPGFRPLADAQRKQAFMAGDHLAFEQCLHADKSGHEGIFRMVHDLP